jgi:hypothetical protein
MPQTLQELKNIMREIKLIVRDQKGFKKIIEWYGFYFHVHEYVVD